MGTKEKHISERSQSSLSVDTPGLAPQGWAGSRTTGSRSTSLLRSPIIHSNPDFPILNFLFCQQWLGRTPKTFLYLSYFSLGINHAKICHHSSLFLALHLNSSVLVRQQFPFISLQCSHSHGPCDKNLQWLPHRDSHRSSLPRCSCQRARAHLCPLYCRHLFTYLCPTGLGAL